MIVDSSAIVAVFFQEPGFEDLIEKLAQAKSVGVGAPTLAETAIVLSARLQRDARGMLERFLHEFQMETVPFGDAHWRAAQEAYVRFGKGRHRAALNFGDCLSYATARLADRPLLCTGKDFAGTDLTLA